MGCFLVAITKVLKKIPCFREFDPSVLEPIAEACNTMFFNEEERVFRKGDQANKMFFIQEGIVDVVGFSPSKSQFVLSSKEPGEFFGAMEMLTGTPRSTTVKARKNLMALVLDHRGFLDILAKSPSSALCLLKTIGRSLSERIRQLNEQFIFTRAIASTLDNLELNRQQILEGHPDALIARSLDTPTLEFFEKLGPGMTLGPDEVIIPEGGRQRDFYVLLEGEAVVKKSLRSGSEMVLAFLKPGCIFGEMSFLDHGSRSAQVTSLTPVKLAAFWEKRMIVLEKTDIRHLNLIYLGIIRHIISNIEHTSQGYLEIKQAIEKTCLL